MRNKGVDPLVAEHVINTGNALPIHQGPRRCSPETRKKIQENVEELLKSGIIKASRSPWSSPVVLVPKKGGKTRFCVDYRKLNDVTRKEIYSIPRCDDVLDGLGGKRWFSTLDLQNGYFQIPLSESSKEKTAFATWNGHYEFNYMSFGLATAPCTFQRAMDSVLAGLKYNVCQVYLDDVIISSKTFKEHIQYIAKVLKRFQTARLKLRSSKCHFCCSEVQYLGHLITRDGVRPNPDKIALIAKWEVPKSAANLLSIIGLAGYYRKFIPNFARYEAQLRKAVARATDPKNKNGKWNLTASEIECF